MKIYHQTGHNYIWNFSSFNDHGIGNGMILSPVHMAMAKVKDLNQDIKRNCLFDPQFYVPDSQKAKLNTYDFFPEKIMDGFSTEDYTAVAYDAARKCVKFQIENEFESLIIPCRYYGDMITDYIDRQKVFSVEPFLSAIENTKLSAKVFLSLPLTVPMIMDKAYRLKILNWITSYPEIDGIYLLVNFGENTKQILDYKKIVSYLSFIEEASNADLEVICGYNNTEILLCTLLQVAGITIGAYENTRHFSIDKFLDDDSEKRGPAPRIYFPNLLNWIRWDTAMEIKEDYPNIWNKIYSPTTHLESLFDSGQRPHFSKPELYKHYFELIYGQVNDLLKAKNVSNRKTLLQSMINDANNLYSEIEKSGVLFFDINCKGEHLPVWARVIRKLSTS